MFRLKNCEKNFINVLCREGKQGKLLLPLPEYTLNKNRICNKGPISRWKKERKIPRDFTDDVSLEIDIRISLFTISSYMIYVLWLCVMI